MSYSHIPTIPTYIQVYTEPRGVIPLAQTHLYKRVCVGGNFGNSGNT